MKTADASPISSLKQTTTYIFIDNQHSQVRLVQSLVIKRTQVILL